MTGKKHTRARFFSGVAALTIGNILVKLLGLALKVPLRELLTDEGMAYYNNAYDIYAAMFTVATAGLPVAVSMFISESRVNGRRRRASRVFSVATALFIIIGAIGTSVMLFGAGAFEAGYRITDLRFTIIAIAPTMLFICVASSLRGYFQGYQNMYPTAISEIIEAVGKFALGILLGVYAARRGYGLPVIAAYAAFGITAGVLLGMIYLWINKAFFRPEKYDSEYASLEDDGTSEGIFELAKKLLVIAIPISLSNSVSSFATVIDGMILSRRIQDAGFTETAMKVLVGNYRTCATPLYNLALVFVGPITASVVPVLAASIAEKDKERSDRIMNGSLLLMSVVVMPCALGLSALSEPIIKLIFGGGTNAEAAAPLLSVLALAAFFSSMIGMTSTILHTYKYMKEPIISIVIGAVIRMGTVWALAGIPQVNVWASPVSSVLGCVTIVSVNLVFIRKKIGFTPRFSRVLVKPFAAGLICAGVAFGSYYLLSRLVGEKIGAVAAILIAAAAYLASVILLKAFEEEDLLLLPK
ncbi:MAG: polysaccharide biosynthesis protein, partial [Clostridia bacterium]|nr:polysaccharide biosynthesis protein [Clostridia bacterium]